ncbi:hypothetical protein MIMGU_mgv1a004012mg [Erythranthe guttata]|uniref:EF-hand domain-containing protein n=1 Tax=Erythranthe guttata TaxID=4155 RepID=A0A022Q910_ERYGU|nr:hypothetical protein MIMGU_mgv1a004012mg [Erythranthe guttata]
MELHLSLNSPSRGIQLSSKPNSTVLVKFTSINSISLSLENKIRRRRRRKISSSSSVVALEQPGGKMVVELVGAFNELTGRMSHSSLVSSRLLFKVLKLSIPILHSLPLLPDEGGGGISIYQLRDRIGSTGTAHLIHESMRLKNISSKVVDDDALDDETASALRKYCLTYYDVRAIILELVLKLDTIRHLHYLPRYKQQMISLHVIKIYAPLAHAVGINHLSLELEDLSFQYLFPHSYIYVDTWLRSHETGSKPLIEIFKDQLLRCLRSDHYLTEMVQDISVEGRYKSRYSTMKKLLRDGRKPEEVNDVLGLRVILSPRPDIEHVEKACYRAREIIQSIWKEMPARSKDYIMHPKANGYKSLHMAVDISDNGGTRPLMEIQIRTAEMDMLAAGGTASHALFKAGLTDPQEAKRLKVIMMAAAELAAVRLKDFPSRTNHNKGHAEIDERNRVFLLLDKNGDGKISIEELMEVMEELGAQGEDAREMMQLLDSNTDGSLSSDEFDLFQKQVDIMRNLELSDVQYKTMLNEKLQMEDCNGLTQVHSEEQLPLN